jgi:hypothetical protein
MTLVPPQVNTLVEYVKSHIDDFYPLQPIDGELYRFAMDIRPKLIAESPEDTFKISPGYDYDVMRANIFRIPNTDKKLRFRVTYDTRRDDYTTVLSDDASDLVANTQFGKLAGTRMDMTLGHVVKELERRLGIKFLFVPATPERQEIYAEMNSL